MDESLFRTSMEEKGKKRQVDLYRLWSKVGGSDKEFNFEKSKKGLDDSEYVRPDTEVEISNDGPSEVESDQMQSQSEESNMNEERFQSLFDSLHIGSNEESTSENTSNQ